MDFHNNPSSQLNNHQREAIVSADAYTNNVNLPTYTDLVIALAAATGELVSEDTVQNADEMVDRATGFNADAAATAILTKAMQEMLNRGENIQENLSGRAAAVWVERRHGWCERQADAVRGMLSDRYGAHW